MTVVDPRYGTSHSSAPIAFANCATAASNAACRPVPSRTPGSHQTYPGPDRWALRAAPFLLGLGMAESGKS